MYASDLQITFVTPMIKAQDRRDGAPGRHIVDWAVQPSGPGECEALAAAVMVYRH